MIRSIKIRGGVYIFILRSNDLGAVPSGPSFLIEVYILVLLVLISSVALRASWPALSLFFRMFPAVFYVHFLPPHNQAPASLSQTRSFAPSLPGCLLGWSSQLACLSFSSPWYSPSCLQSCPQSPAHVPNPFLRTQTACIWILVSTFELSCSVGHTVLHVTFSTDLIPTEIGKTSKF